MDVGNNGVLAAVGRLDVSLVVVDKGGVLYLQCEHCWIPWLPRKDFRVEVPVRCPRCGKQLSKAVNGRRPPLRAREWTEDMRVEADRRLRSVRVGEGLSEEG